MTMVLFDKVKFISPARHKEFGEMTVIEIRTPEQADFYVSYEIICRSENFPMIVDCREQDLEIIEIPS
jgi:hypothetical protein